ncbi:MAG: N-acetyl sugar amidotransferase [Burkholderiaceae bacterium]|uniref:N-acetyl sugar amidotransferase n=1 Tax=Polaromonas sp. YR568 TaxID=1855301 RepID=UPI002726AC05|nr:N-acetyl sugar amidotransferase [Burkholderiaceae bacterium]MDO9316899.1 N-acetyl sugar amidotransferase [Gammaproteobacteria bacterium]
MSFVSAVAPQACKRCLYTTDHPLGLTLDAEGICSGCRIHEEKDTLDWELRWRRLEELVQPHRSRAGNYDCIVPVSGANDSYFIVHTVKERLGLNPLLVTYNKYFNTPLGIRNLANLRIRFNCDILVQNVNPVSVRAITRASLRQFGSIYWPCIAGQTVFPVQTAVRYRIPLIVWGAHQGLEQVGMFSHEHEVQMTRRYRKDHDLMGHEADDLLGIFDTLREDHIWQYRYPDDQELHAAGVTGIYLGNYVRWDPKAQHEQMMKLYDYRTASSSRTFDCYDHVDCYNFIDLHDQIKLYKHGYSKVTDHACREIRHGRLTRVQGLALVRKYEHASPRFAGLFQEWLGVTASSLQFLLDQHRNPRCWDAAEPGQWVFRGASTREPGAETDAAPAIPARAHFQATDPWPTDNAKYIVIGKGYP